MKIVSWNVNGIRAIWKKGFMDWVEENDPDILCLQETKVQSEQLSQEMWNISSYIPWFSFAEKKGYSGVAVYSKGKPCSVSYGFGNGEKELEGRVLSLTYPDFTLWNIYFPNGKMSDARLAYKLDFYGRLILFFKENLVKNPNHIIVGDFNTAHYPIDLARPKENEKISGFLKEERVKLDEMLELGFVDMFRSLYPGRVDYTWFSNFANARERNIGWRIDYQYVSATLKNQVKDSIIQSSVMGSDHCPIELVL
jgi:exodeoxyribonuclease-3